MSKITLLSISLSVVMLCPLHANTGPKPGEEECPKELAARLDKMEQRTKELDGISMKLSGHVNKAGPMPLTSIGERLTFLKGCLGTKNTIEPTESSIELAAPVGQIRYAMEDVE